MDLDCDNFIIFQYYSLSLGKNKNAAQNCRKRANDRLDDLKTDVTAAKRRKLDLEQECSRLEKEFNRIKWINDQFER